MKPDLNGEAWDAAQRVGQQELHLMEARGVPAEAIMHLGRSQYAFGLQRVRETTGGLYEPDEDGRLSVIMPVVISSIVDFFGLEFDAGEIIDLVAFRTDNPARWSWRTGHGWALGEDLFDGDLPVWVVATPLDWLKAGGGAVCILDWSAPPQCWARLRSGPTLQFTDDALRLKVRNALVANVALPPMELANAA